MIPGIDPRQMKQMMRQLGMSQVDINAVEVIIKTPTDVYVFKNPDVQKIVMKGQTTFQISGKYDISESVAEIKISNDDIEMVTNQTGVSTDVAAKALEKANGDIAQAIIDLSEDN